MKYFFVTISTIIFIAFPPKEKDYIVWKEDRKLKWEDFEGYKPNSSDFPTASSVQLRLSHKVRGSRIRYKMNCIFIKTRSWATVKTKFALNHEQKHFDIGEIYARVFRKTVSENKSMAEARNEYKLDSLLRILSGS